MRYINLLYCIYYTIYLSLWINNETKIEDNTKIKDRQNSTSYFDSDSKKEPVKQLSKNTKSYNLPSIDLLDDLKEIKTRQKSNC